MTIDDVFGSEFIILNNNLCAVLGVEKAVILSYIYNRITQADYVNKYRASHNGFFFMTLESIEERYQLKPQKQRTLLTELVADGLLEIKLIGTPPKRHVRLNEGAIVHLIEQHKAAQASKKVVSHVTASKDKDEFYEDLNRSIWEGFNSF